MSDDAEVRTLPSYAAGEIRMSHAIRVHEERLSTRTQWEDHSHPTHELIWNQEGVSHVSVGQRTWTISPMHALWMPAGVQHAGLAPGGTWVRSTHFDVHATATIAEVPVPVEVTPLLRLLLERLADPDLPPASRTITESMVLDVLEPAPHAIVVHIPDAPLLAPVVEALLADPGDQRTLTDWADALGVSGRTITRAFHRETGQGFTQWVAAVRAQRAAQLLADGEPIIDVMEDVGYTSQSAFGAAFRRVAGLPPGAYVAAGGEVSETR